MVFMVGLVWVGLTDYAQSKYITEVMSNKSYAFFAYRLEGVGYVEVTHKKKDCWTI